MLVTEYDRNQLFVWFEQHMGKEVASTMMSLLPPVGWGEVATRRDVDLAVERLETKIERLDVKIDAAVERLDVKIDVVAERLDTKIDSLDLKIEAVADRLRSDLQRTFVTWMFAAQGAVVGAVGLMLVALR